MNIHHFGNMATRPRPCLCGCGKNEDEVMAEETVAVTKSIIESAHRQFKDMGVTQNNADMPYQPPMNVIYKGGYVPELAIGTGDRYNGWLLYRHPDGQWVTLVDLKKHSDLVSTRPSPVAEGDGMKMLFSNEWLRQKIENDPDIEYDAGIPSDDEADKIISEFLQQANPHDEMDQKMTKIAPVLRKAIKQKCWLETLLKEDKEDYANWPEWMKECSRSREHERKSSAPLPGDDPLKIEYPVTTEGEWFFRWAARAMGGRVTDREAISVIFHHPENPYADKNPWSAAPVKTLREGER